MLRRTRLGAHVLWGSALAACTFPLIGEDRRQAITQRWSRQLLDILAVRLDAQASDATPGSLIVANHVSWLDIYALNAARPMRFVAKADVRRWPLIGWLAASAGTVFLHRGNRSHARQVNAQIDALLNAGTDVTIFPEGTTTDGTCVLNFHAALLQPAVDAGRPVLPIALSYHDADGQRSLAPSYAGKTTMNESLAAILACRSLTVRLRPKPSLDTSGKNRRQLAHEAQQAIAASLGVSTGNSADETLR